MKISLVLIFTCLSISNCLYSQLFKKPIDYRFKGGEDGYISFFSRNIKVSDQAIENGTFGNSITRISVNPKGEIGGITTINTIDTIIDNEVLRVIDLSKTLWKKCDTLSRDQIFYIQVGFSVTGFLPNLFNPKSETLIKLFPKSILITMEGDFKIPFITSKELSEKANFNMDNGKYEEALPFINELIKRDPFNRDLYQARIEINIRLNRPELVDQDDSKIFQFAEGFSLDEINRAQDN